MKRIPILLPMVCALAALAAPAHAAQWSFGSNLGVGFESQQDSDVLTSVSVPSSMLLFQPGTRIGWLGPNPANEVFLDSGLLFYSFSGSNRTLLLATGNYQRNVSPRAPQSPFVTVGAGVLLQGLTDINATSVVFGGGVGVRKWISDGHGTFRFEVRADRIASAQEINRAGLTVISIRFGVDLWMGRPGES